MRTDTSLDDQTLYDSVVDLMRLVDVYHMFTISPVTRDGGQEMVKIEVKGWDGTAFIISSIAQIDSVVALSQAWFTQRAGEKS